MKDFMMDAFVDLVKFFLELDNDISRLAVIAEMVEVNEKFADILIAAWKLEKSHPGSFENYVRILSDVNTSAWTFKGVDIS